MNVPPSRLRGVYPITPDIADTPRLLAAVADVLAAGPALLQYRNKPADRALRYTQAGAIAALCRDAAVPLIINDDVELAADLQVGVHVGVDDGDPAAARARLGPHAIVGVSCYASLARAAEAVAAGASYLAFGAFFPTRTKITAHRADVGLLRDAARFGLPRVAIGGLQPDNARPLVDAGADLLATIGAVFDAPDPQQAVRAFARCFDIQTSASEDSA
jgi:thiamine-phosphate pyrophosphorylase